MIDYFNSITFQNPWFLVLLLLLPLIGAWYYYNVEKRFPQLTLPTVGSLAEVSSWKGKLIGILPLLRALTFMLIVLALARPQLTLKEEEIKAEGIDIMLAIDLSSSMLARDFEPNRLEASKEVAIDFVSNRPYDRIGVVVFSGEAFTQTPLTSDHEVVKTFINDIQYGRLEDGTAIGMGLATAVNRLKESKAKSKVVILLTDGENNAGYIQPIIAAEIAQELNVKVYTVGIGSRGSAVAPVSKRTTGEFIFGLTRVNIDEKLLTEIAEMTGGRYYRADSEEKLERIYSLIDKLEKTEMEITSIKRYSEEFYPLVFFALLFLFVEMILRYTVFRTIP